jgi:ubiquinone/menaquinone biosynthesis C-methylase UbiE
MSKKNLKIIRDKYERGYKIKGIDYQRKYPNEELCRFIGRNFSSVSKKRRRKIKILEVGSGSGGNLWMLANEGFKTFGLDISKKSIKLAKDILRKKKLKANLSFGSMTGLPYKDNYFDCIIDIFSSCCLDSEDGKSFLSEVYRTLKKNGSFFSYFPSKKSKMFKSKYKKMVDRDTIINLKSKKNAYRIDNCPFRFLNKKQYVNFLKINNLKTFYSEEIQKTYFNGKENFNFLVIEGKKN